MFGELKKNKASSGEGFGEWSGERDLVVLNLARRGGGRGCELLKTHQQAATVQLVASRA